MARPSASDGRTGRFAAVGRTAVARLRSLHGRTLALAAGTLVVCAALMVAGALLFRDGDTRPPVPDTRARHYTEVDACLLTDGKGITAGTAAAQVWQGMQDASLKTHARVSYAQVTGKQTTGHALPFLNSLLQRSCEVVLATGRAEVAATAQAAPRQGKVDFVLVGGGHEGGNVTVLATGKGLRAEVAAAVEHAVDGRA
jgi:basic membrane lipoprotein Med (substrate-binding protein (PBP1-ABC) superfamily)